MNIEDAYKALKNYYGTHGKAAAALGISARQYAAYRLGEFKIPKGRQNHVLMLAEKVTESASAPEA